MILLFIIKQLYGYFPMQLYLETLLSEPMSLHVHWGM